MAKTAKICPFSQNSLCKIFKQIRILITKEYEKISKLNGKIEVRGKRGYGAGRKTPIFGMLKVYTQVLKACFTNEFLPNFDGL